MSYLSGKVPFAVPPQAKLPVRSPVISQPVLKAKPLPGYTPPVSRPPAPLPKPVVKPLTTMKPPSSTGTALTKVSSGGAVVKAGAMPSLVSADGDNKNLYLVLGGLAVLFFLFGRK